MVSKEQQKLHDKICRILGKRSLVHRANGGEEKQKKIEKTWNKKTQQQNIDRKKRYGKDRKAYWDAYSEYAEAMGR